MVGGRKGRGRKKASDEFTATDRSADVSKHDHQVSIPLGKNRCLAEHQRADVGVLAYLLHRSTGL